MQGVALFEVHGDRHVVYFDLYAVGLRRISIEPDQFRALDDVEEELRDLITKYGDLTNVENVGFEYSDWPSSRRFILARLYLQDGLVRLVLLTSYERNIVTKLSERLRRLGWRPIFIFDIRKAIKSTKRSS